MRDRGPNKARPPIMALLFVLGLRPALREFLGAGDRRVVDGRVGGATGRGFAVATVLLPVAMALLLLPNAATAEALLPVAVAVL